MQMGNLIDDLDKFLRTDGIKILVKSGDVKVKAYEPLTEEDIDDFGSMNLDNLNQETLENLLDKAEDLRDDMEDREPEDEESEEHDLWEDRLSEIEDFIDRIQNHLDDLEED